MHTKAIVPGVCHGFKQCESTIIVPLSKAKLCGFTSEEPTPDREPVAEAATEPGESGLSAPFNNMLNGRIKSYIV